MKSSKGIQSNDPRTRMAIVAKREAMAQSFPSSFRLAALREAKIAVLDPMGAPVLPSNICLDVPVPMAFCPPLKDVPRASVVASRLLR